MFPFPFGELARYVDELPTREHHEAMREACEVLAALSAAWSRRSEDLAPHDAATLGECAIHLRSAMRHFDALANTPPTLRPGPVEEADPFTEAMEKVVPPGAGSTGGDTMQEAPEKKPYTPPTLRLVGSERNIASDLGAKPHG